MPHNIQIPQQIPFFEGNTIPRILYASHWDDRIHSVPRSLHQHKNTLEFSLVLSGSSICEIGGALYPITAGDLFILNSGVLHDEFVGTHMLVMDNIGATDIQIPGLPANHLIPPDVSPVIHLGSAAEELQNLAHLIYKRAKSGSPNTGTVCQALFTAFYVMVLDLLESTRSAPSTNPCASDIGHQIRAYADEHFTEELTVKEVAEHFQISTSYLARVFKETVGCSLSAYLIRLRLGKAQELLVNSSLSLAEISEIIGYPYQSYFSKLFSQAYGISPLQYRKIARDREINVSASPNG